MKKSIFDRLKNVEFDVISLVVVNLFTIYGVVFLNWSLFSVLFLYWTESAIIGFYNIFKMIISPTFPKEVSTYEKYGPAWATFLKVFVKIIYVPFFMFHYGMFMFGHLVFVYFVSFASYIFEHGGQFPPTAPVSQSIIISVLLLFLSHGISFVKNFIIGKEYKSTSTMALMVDPYMRVILMHLTLLFGAFLIIPATMIIQTQKLTISLQPVLQTIIISLFIILKIKFDLAAHDREHAIQRVG